jgi:hypothetical protein
VRERRTDEVNAMTRDDLKRHGRIAQAAVEAFDEPGSIRRLAWITFVLGGALLAMLSAAPASGQVKIEAKPTTRDVKPRLVQPFLEPPPPEVREDQRRPELPFVPYEPAFIAPFSREFETSSGATGRAGLSFWTAPGSAVGASGAYREVNGWAAAGLSIVWGGRPRAASDDAPSASISARGTNRSGTDQFVHEPSHEPAPEPLHVGDLVRRTKAGGRQAGHVVTFVEHEGVSYAEVEWLGSGGSAPTYEPLSRLERVVPAGGSR